MTHAIRPIIATLAVALTLSTAPAAHAGDELLVDKLVDPEGLAEDLLGGGGLSPNGFPQPTRNALAVDGDLLAVGAPGRTQNGLPGMGQLLVYRRVEGEWTLEARIPHPDPGTEIDPGPTGFGASVDVRDGRIAVSAPNPDNHVDELGGRVWIFERVDGAWQATFEAESAFELSAFGRSLALSEERLVIRDVRSESEPPVFQVFANVYRRDGPSWSLEQAVPIQAIPGSASAPGITSVDIEGELIMVGDSGALNSEGAVRVLRFDGVAWQPDALIPTSDAAATAFGERVVTDGETLAVLSRLLTGPAVVPDMGLVTLFERDGDSWLQADVLPLAEQRFITLSTLDLDGDTLVAGTMPGPAFFDTGEPGFFTVFRRTEDAWRRTQQVTPDDAMMFDRFGSAVGLVGNALLVSAPQHEPGGLDDQGAVYVFELDARTWTNAGDVLAGADSDTLLQGFGDLSDDSVARVELVNAKPDAPLALFVALQSTPVPFVGGTLAAFPNLVPPMLASTDAEGSFEMSFPVRPGAIPTGEAWFQVAFMDDAAPQGVALSNALRGMTR